MIPDCPLTTTEEGYGLAGPSARVAPGEGMVMPPVLQNPTVPGGGLACGLEVLMTSWVMAGEALAAKLPPP